MSSRPSESGRPTALYGWLKSKVAKLKYNLKWKEYTIDLIFLIRGFGLNVSDVVHAVQVIPGLSMLT